MNIEELTEFHLEVAEECYEEGNFKDAKEIISQLLDYPNSSSNHYEISKIFHAYRLLHQAIVKGKTHYEILEIKNINSTQKVIEKSYKDLKLMFDAENNESVAVKEAFEFVESAWEVLSDPEKRRVYDNELGFRKRRFSYFEDRRDKKRKLKRNCGVEIIEISDSDSGSGSDSGFKNESASDTIIVVSDSDIDFDSGLTP